MKRISYKTRTRRIEKEIERVESLLKPLQEKAVRSHHKIKTSDIEFKTPTGEIKKFKDAIKLKKYISKQKKVVAARKLRMKERELSKKATAQNKKILKELEKEYKKLEKEASKLKGKRKDKKLSQAEELKRNIASYKKAKKEKGLKVPNLPKNKKKAKQTLQQFLGREKANQFASSIWGYWELAFADDVYMLSNRETLYRLAQENKLDDLDIETLEELFELWYMYAKTDIIMAEEIKGQIIAEVEAIIDRIINEKPSDDTKQWS